MTDELDETEALAAEYALGTLEPTARAAVQQRLRTDPEFARLIELWEQRLAPLAEAIPPVEPPPAAWLALAQALAAEARPAPLQRVRVRHHGPLYSVTFWRRCALAAGALAAVLALYVAGTVLRPPAAPSAARYVAVLDRGEVSPALIVTIEPDAGRAIIRPLAVEPAGDRALELWLVAGQGRPPRSLGLLDPHKETALTLPAEVRAAVEPSAALAISLEPPGGSPTGQPTGPVIYEGPLLTLGK